MLESICSALVLSWNLATVVCLLSGLWTALFGTRPTTGEIEKIERGFR